MRDISRLPNKRKRLGTSEREIFVPSYNIQRKRLGVSLLEEQRRQRSLKRLARSKAKEKAVKIKPKIYKAKVPKKKEGIAKKKHKIRCMPETKVKRTVKVRKPVVKIKPKPKLKIKHKPVKKEKAKKVVRSGIKIKINLPKIEAHKRVFEISKRMHEHIKSHAVRHAQNIKDVVKKHGKGFWQKGKEMDQKVLSHLKKAHSGLKSIKKR